MQVTSPREFTKWRPAAQRRVPAQNCANSRVGCGIRPSLQEVMSLQPSTPSTLANLACVRCFWRSGQEILLKPSAWSIYPPPPLPPRFLIVTSPQDIRAFGKGLIVSTVPECFELEVLRVRSTYLEEFGWPDYCSCRSCGHVSFSIA